MAQVNFLLVTVGLTFGSLTITAGLFLPRLSAQAAETRTSSRGGPANLNEIDSWDINGDTGADSLLFDCSYSKVTAAGSPPPASQSTSGGLRVSENGRFLVREDGTPFFWLGDSAQLLLYRLSREDVTVYLQHRASLGFTVIETQIVSFLGINATNFYGNAPFINGDPTSPNEPFWQHVDYVINKAASFGLVIALVPDRNLIVIDDSANKFGPLTSASAYAYGQYIGRRYRGKPVAWVLGWDIRPGSREAVFQAEADGIAQGAADGDHSKVLISFHPPPSMSSSNWFQDRAWLDFNSIQSGHMDNNEAHNFPENHTLVTSDYAKVPAKPTLDGEPAYEDTQDGVWNPTKGVRMTADVVRRKAYWAVFAGALGHTYGHNDIVAFHQSGQPSYSGQRNYWKAALDAPGATAMRHLRTLFESRPYFVRIPDQSVLVSGAASGLDHVRATRASDGSYLFVYIPNGRSVTVNMRSIVGQAVQASWFDPRTGTFSAIGQFCNGEIQSFDAPGNTQTGNDWVLVLDGLSEATPPSSSPDFSPSLLGGSSTNVTHNVRLGLDHTSISF
jgi:hypothetical protein